MRLTQVRISGSTKAAKAVSLFLFTTRSLLNHRVKRFQRKSKMSSDLARVKSAATRLWLPESSIRLSTSGEDCELAKTKSGPHAARRKLGCLCHLSSFGRMSKSDWATLSRRDGIS